MLQTKEYTEGHPKLDILEFNQMLITTKDSRNDIYSCKYI